MFRGTIFPGLCYSPRKHKLARALMSDVRCWRCWSGAAVPPPVTALSVAVCLSDCSPKLSESLAVFVRLAVCAILTSECARPLLLWFACSLAFDERLCVRRRTREKRACFIVLWKSLCAFERWFASVQILLLCLAVRRRLRRAEKLKFVVYNNNHVGYCRQPGRERHLCRI